MKISFPYMGCVTGYKKIMEALGHEVIAPKLPTQKTIDLGVLHSPEFICFPFKVMLGTYIEVCEQGAEVIVSSGGSGPCRAGLYCEIHKRVLKKLGYETQLVIFDSLYENPKYFYEQLKLIKNRTPLMKVLADLYFIYKLIKQMDDLEKKRNIERAYEITQGDYDTCFRRIVSLHEKCFKMKDLKKAREESFRMLEAIPKRTTPEQERIRVGLIGEIYVVMETTTNQNIEKKLNSLGAEVYNTQYISEWLNHSLISKKLPISKRYKLYKSASAYKSIACGGHDMENTGHIVDFQKEGFDGAVHLQPFGCLPELITRTTLPKISEELNFPVLSISLDELTGETNTLTRLEAFTELLKSKKTRVVYDNASVEGDKVRLPNA